MYSENYTRQTAMASAERAKDPNLTDHDLAGLARSEEAMVRATVAERAATPLTVLLKLMEDEAPVVRAGVARNPRTDIPKEVHLQLARDKSPEVVSALVANPAVPTAVIAKLARSRHKNTAVLAQQRLKSKGGAASLLGMVGIASS